MYITAGMLAAGFSAAVGAQGRVVKKDPYEVKPPTRQQVQEAREWARDLGKKARQVAPRLHMGETAHFYLFSAFTKKADDKRFSDTAERMYKELCRQFKADPRTVWVDKCPIFAFENAKQYVAFCKAIGVDAAVAEKSGGLMYSRNGNVCIVLNATADETQFYHTMVHEGTHGFMARYLTIRPIPVWVNEGIAEYTCAAVIENGRASKMWQEATKQVLAGEKKPQVIFDDVWQMDSFHYGMAHALVRYMIQKDGNAFSKFIRLMKQGESEEKALKTAYNTDRAGLIRGWLAAAEKMLKAAEKAAEKTAEK